ncbi:hypothetical protein LCGC14_2644780, partial [marine sediment metagenome]
MNQLNNQPDTELEMLRKKVYQLEDERRMYIEEKDLFKQQIKELKAEKFKAIEIIEKIRDQHCDSDPLRKLLNEAQKTLE